MNINIEILTKALAENCMTWKDLSKKSGISTVTLARIHKGIQEPQPVTVGKIAKALNLDLEQVIEKKNYSERGLTNEINTL